MKWWLIGGILLFISLSGCSNSTPIQTPDPIRSEQTSPVSTPISSETIFSSSIIATPSDLADIPTPSSPDRGTVTGILILDGNSKQPVPEAILYLGSIIRSSDNAPVLTSLDKQTAPKTQSNLKGQFIFEDVPAGQYVLILDLIVSSFILHSPTGEDMIIQVEGGQIVDLGELIYSDLPIPSSSPSTDN